VLIILVLVFIARRIMVVANSHRVVGPSAANSDGAQPPREDISPNDRRTLGNLIQHRTQP
jgi:hypothetical protein